MHKVTLTFDNGPDPEVTPAVLDTLRHRGILATFFVIGDKLRDRKSPVERAHDEGHWIGNHTFTHLVPLGDINDAKRTVWEIERTQELIGGLAHPRRFFRPLGRGAIGRQLLNSYAAQYLATSKYTCVLWDTIPQDWILTDDWVKKAISQCLRQEESCVVLHDLPTGSMKHLDRFIGTLVDSGVQFSQNFPVSCIPMEKGQAMGSFESYVTRAGMDA